MNLLTEALDMKQRTLSKQSPVKPTFYCWSSRHNRANLFESELELDFFTFLEFEYSDCIYMSQPYSIEYKVGGKLRRYTPDFLLEQDGHTTLIEIKIFEHTLSDVFIRKYAIIKEHFASIDKSFVVITEKDIRVGHRVQNLKFLRPVLHLPSPEKEWIKIQESIPVFSGSVLALQEKLVEIGAPASLARQAVAHKLVDCDLTQCWDELSLSW
jgi:hypothetical protein